MIAAQVQSLKPIWVACAAQGHIGQQPLDAVPSFGGNTTTGTEGSYRLWDPSKVPTPSAIVAALDRFVVGQEATKKVHNPALPRLGLLGKWGSVGDLDEPCLPLCVLSTSIQSFLARMHI